MTGCDNRMDMTFDADDKLYTLHCGSIRQNAVP